MNAMPLPLNHHRSQKTIRVLVLISEPTAAHTIAYRENSRDISALASQNLSFSFSPGKEAIHVPPDSCTIVIISDKLDFSYQYDFFSSL
jgi:hypothetical protein